MVSCMFMCNTNGRRTIRIGFECWNAVCQIARQQIPSYALCTKCSYLMMVMANGSVWCAFKNVFVFVRVGFLFVVRLVSFVVFTRYNEWRARAITNVFMRLDWPRAAWSLCFLVRAKNRAFSPFGLIFCHGRNRSLEGRYIEKFNKCHSESCQWTGT